MAEIESRQTMRSIVILQQLSIDVKRPEDICEEQDNLLIVQTSLCRRRFREIGLYTCDCDGFAAWFSEMFNTFNTAISWGTSENWGMC